MNEHSDTDDNGDGDGEGVWSPDIEQCFREALLLFPPCGRRKHILQEEGGGKMYGRNELIARHIRMRTGKIRSRKQVSSHIQVLARRRAKAEAGANPNAAAADSMADLASPANSVGMAQVTESQDRHLQASQAAAYYFDQWTDRPIVTTKIRLVEFSAFIEYRRQLVPLEMAPASKAPVVGLNSIATAAIEHGQNPMTALPMAATQQGLLVPAYGPPDQTTATQVPITANQQLTSPHHHHHHQQQQQQTTPSNFYQSLEATTAATNQYRQPPQGVNSQTLTQQQQQQQQPLNNNQQHHQQMNQRNTEANNFMLTNSASSLITNYQQQPTPTSSGFTRHSYVKIDYRQPSACRQTNKLEPIDISHIQDKFPEIGGSEGLFQRGPSDAFFLVKFWADINNDFEYNIEDQNSYFGFSCHFEAIEPFKDITCSTKACSYGLQVVEKVEKIYGAFNSSNGRYSYNIDRSPMCEFMIQFIKKLRQLPRASQMNSVLENFTVLQVITSESTSEILMCLAYVFEIAPAEQSLGSQYNVYKLTKD